MNAVSEIKVMMKYTYAVSSHSNCSCFQRNLPDLSTSFNASQHQPASFQLLDGRPAEQRPTWETRSRFEVEKEMAELKKLQQKIGDSLEWILETLSQEDESESAVLRKRQALESLAYAKDILKGSVLAVDDTRLLRRKGAQGARVDGQGIHPSNLPRYPHFLATPFVVIRPPLGFEAQRIAEVTE
jgi:hypothetical protein